MAECTIDCPTTATTPSDDEGPNTLLIVLIVTIPCALVIVLLACLSTIICFLIFRHRDNPDETEAAYAKRRFHQGLSLEEQRKMQKKKKKNRVTKVELFRKRKSMQSNPKLEEKSHVRHNPLRVRDWQMRMSKESGEGDTEETDIDADADDLFQQINNRRMFGSFGAINPLLLQQMGEFGEHHPGYDTPPRDPQRANATADRHTHPEASQSESEEPSEESSDEECFSPYDT